MTKKKKFTHIYLDIDTQYLTHKSSAGFLKINLLALMDKEVNDYYLADTIHNK